MSELLREIQEDIEREKWASLWQRYGRAVIMLAIAIIALVAIQQVWKSYKHSQGEKQTSLLLDAVRKPEADGFANVAKKTQGVHQGIARLIQAQLLMAEGKASESESVLKTVAKEGNDMPAQLASALTATDSIDTLRNTAFYATALERNGWVAIENGDLQTAEASFTALLQLEEAPESMKERAKAATAYIQSQKSDEPKE